MVPKQLQKQILEENHSGIMHVVIYCYKKFYIITYIAIINSHNNNIAITSLM